MKLQVFILNLRKLYFNIYELFFKEELDKLNNLVWPAILKEAKKQISNLYEQGINVIVLEAAVLIQANWQSYCHEIWTCIIPEEEVRF